MVPKGAPGASRRHEAAVPRRPEAAAPPRYEALESRWAGRMRWIFPVLPLVLAALVHRRALGAFFGVDDFVRLEEAAGLLPSGFTVWRLVSEVLYVRLMLALFGPEPLPFHIVSLALHLANTALVYRLGRRAGLSAAAACFASSVFGSFPILYTVLLSAVNINDILALTFVFAALIALEKPGRARVVAAVASFALALLSKEAVLFVPFAAIGLPLPGERPREAARRLAPLLVTGIVFAGLYLAFRRHGLGTGGLAYSMGFGVNLFHNLMTYAYWCVDLVRAVPDATALVDTQAWRVGLVPLMAMALAALLSRSLRGVIVFGFAWWVLGLAAVLPLAAHTYGHYLYVPMVGWALAGTGVLLAAGRGIARPVPRAPKRNTAPLRVAEVALVVLAIGFAARSEMVFRERVSARLGSTAFALDPFTRKMEVAQRAISTLTGQLDREHDSVVVFNPPGLGKSVMSSTGREVDAPPLGATQYDVVEAVLGGGRALHLFEPRIDSMVFAQRWTPAYRGFSLFSEGPGGSMIGFGRGPLSHSKLGRLLLGNGYNAQARGYLADVVLAYPEDRLLRLLFAIALSRTGDPDSARSSARLVVEGAPSDTISAIARRLLASLDAKK